VPRSKHRKCQYEVTNNCNTNCEWFMRICTCYANTTDERKALPVPELKRILKIGQDLMIA
jgi:MoaA/NifB/PqqE/SkfB family radical SAM enzyme